MNRNALKENYQKDQKNEKFDGDKDDDYFKN